MRAVVDGQVQGVGAGAAVGVGIIIGIDARGGVGLSLPGVALTSRVDNDIMCAVVDGQVQRVGAGTGADESVEGISACGGVGLAVPCVALADGEGGHDGYHGVAGGGHRHTEVVEIG